MFITMVLLLVFSDFYEGRDRVGVMDCFAGEARIAKAARYVGDTAVALDVDYHPNRRVFDVNSPAGFAFLGLMNTGFGKG